MKRLKYVRRCQFCDNIATRRLRIVIDPLKSLSTCGGVDCGYLACTACAKSILYNIDFAIGHVSS